MTYYQKYSTLTIVLLTCLTTAVCQSYNTPESVEYYPVDSSYFVGNASSGEILKLTANNTLENFVADLPSGPHGLELIGDTLYACTGSSVHALSASTGEILFNIPIGGSFLNGITHVGNQLFITDFSAKKIITYRIASATFNTFVDDLVKTPNGIIFDSIDNKLVLVNWGVSAPINAISLSDSTITELTSTSLNNCDGIAMDCEGNFYVSSWSPQRISIFDHDFINEPLTADVTGLSNAADIYYNKFADTLVIPNSGNDKVLKTYFESCYPIDTPLSTLNQPAYSLTIYPNPANNYLILEIPKGVTSFKYAIHDYLGQLVNTDDNNNNIIDISYLKPGVYSINIQAAFGKYESHQFIKQ